MRDKLRSKGLTDEEVADYLPDSGYVPRRVQGKSPGFDPKDPDAKGRDPLGGGKGGLSKTTGSLRQRDQIVLETNEGRHFIHRDPNNKDYWTLSSHKAGFSLVYKGGVLMGQTLPSPGRYIVEVSARNGTTVEHLVLAKGWQSWTVERDGKVLLASKP